MLQHVNKNVLGFWRLWSIEALIIRCCQDQPPKWFCQEDHLANHFLAVQNKLAPLHPLGRVLIQYIMES